MRSTRYEPPANNESFTASVGCEAGRSYVYQTAKHLNLESVGPIVVPRIFLVNTWNGY